MKRESTERSHWRSLAFMSQSMAMESFHEHYESQLLNGFWKNMNSKEKINDQLLQKMVTRAFFPRQIWQDFQNALSPAQQ